MGGRKKAAARKKVKKKKKKGKKPGKKPENAEKYRPSFDRVALKIASEGGGPGDIADACGVSVSTVYSWWKTRASFGAVFAEGEKWFEDNAEALFRKDVIAQATPHDEVSVKVKDIMLAGKDKEGNDIEVPAIETETTTKKDKIDIKPLADFIRRRRPDRYAEKRVIGATDEIAVFMDWCAGRNGGDDDGS